MALKLESKPKGGKKIAKFTKDFKLYGKRVSEMKHRGGIRILLKGLKYTAKTWFLASCPGDIITLDPENSIDRVREQVDLHKKGDNIIRCNNYDFEPDTIRDSGTSVDKTEAIIYSLTQAMEKGEISVGTIGFDPISEVWSWIGEWNEDTQRDRGQTTKKETVPMFKWGPANSRIRELILPLLDVGVNLVFIANEVSTRDDPHKAQCPPRLLNWVDYIAHMQIKEIGNKYKWVATLEKIGHRKKTKKIEIEDMSYLKLCKALKEEMDIEIKHVGDTSKCW